MLRFGKQAIPVPDYVIGVDESGTGAFAGPFTVCAYMSHVTHTSWIAQIGARDSKVLTADRRRALCEDLAPAATIAEIIVVPNDYREQKRVWREAVAKAVVHCFRGIDWAADKVALKIDGAPDSSLAQYFTTVWQVRPQFIVKGDALVPQISAASIYAKAVRSGLMLEAHAQYPVYGFSKHDGYGTAEQLAAIHRHGICELHRRVRPLLPYFTEDASTTEP